MSQVAYQIDQGAINEFAAELSQSASEHAASLGGAVPYGPVPQLRSSSAAFTAREPGHASAPPGNLDLIMRIPVALTIVLGQATMSVAELSRLGLGAVIQLDSKVGQPVDIVVNGRLVARGEVVVTDDATGRFGISITEIVSLPGPRAALR